MTKGYIFDYGGTLDTGGNHWGQVLWHAYERQRLPVTEQQFREAYVYGERYLATHPVVTPQFTFRDTLEAKLRLQLDHLRNEHFIAGIGGTEAEALLNDVYGQTLTHTRHSRDVLHRLREQGKPMVLVSNFYGNIATVLQEMGLDGLFATVIESAVVGVRKPNPKIFSLGVEALGLEAGEVTVVGDSLDKDILPAASIGCSTVWIEGEPWDKAAPIDRTVAGRIITDIAEILL